VNPAPAAPVRLGTAGDRLIPAPHTALVYALDGLRFVATAASRRTLIRRLADYVERRTSDSLWPADARQVEMLLAHGAEEEAVELYFALVGKRWDEEWLFLTDPCAT
jgi:hypothetical protein